MSKNTCSPSSLFGGYEQTLFLGCSIINWTATVGWNQQVGQLTVNLVQDPCQVPAGGNPKVYYDSKLNRKTTTAADPGPYIYGDVGIEKGPVIGAPVYFRHGEFEFCGILQNFQEINGSDGRPTYTAIINDPRAILEGAQLIISNYAGSVYDMHNLFNIFGFMESFGTPCPEREVPENSDVVFGTPAGGYGGANVNNNGSQVYQIIQGVSLLTSSFPKFQNAFSPYGRLTYKGSQYGGYGMIRYDNIDLDILPDFGNPFFSPAENYHDGFLAEYYIDLSALPIPPTYWRIQGTYVSIMELITQVCEDAGCDFYIELIPFVTGTSSITKIIKVRTVSRNAQPRLGVVAEFIGDSVGIEQNNKGLEARQENTQSFLIGGKRACLFQAEQANDSDSDYSDDVIIPYFGKDANGEAIIPTKVDDYWRFTVDCTALNLTLNSTLLTNSLTLTEEELMASNAGMNSWFGYICSMNTPSFQAISAAYTNFRGIKDVSHLLKLLDQLGNYLLQPKDVPAANSKTSKKLDDNDLKDLQRIYEFVNTYAESYGRRFLVRIPYTCRRQDTESGLVITSEIPSPDGAYTRETTILGLPHPTVLTDFFGSEDGRVGCFVRFALASDLDLDKLDINEYGIYNNSLYVKAEIEPDLVFVDDTPRVVVNLGQAVEDLLTDEEHSELIIEEARQAAVMINKLRNGGALKIKNTQKMAGAGSTYTAYPNRAVVPNGVAVPLQSNIHTYGPWYISGPPGPIKVDEDPGLVPWEYGGENEMDLAGASRVNEGITYMQCGEYGSITVPGIPTIPLGAELGATFGSGGSQLIENRSILTNGYNNTHHTNGNQSYNYYSANMTNWTGLYGPNITNINVSVSDGGARTTYDFKTYTPQPGRFSRGNSERMKEIGQRRLKSQKAFRLSQFNNARLAGKFSSLKKSQLADRRKNKAKNTQAGQVETPHDILVGSVSQWTNGRRRVGISTISLSELSTELANNYSSKAIMSWDGLIRPIKMAGSSPLPLYQTGGETHLYGAQPPISSLYSNLIGGTYLNPLAIPGGDLGTQYGDTDVGHDFELVARGSTPPGSSMVLPVEPGDGTWDYAAADYRFFALRGPLIIQGWGYDLDGKPIPNRADTEVNASGGTFTSTSLQDKFLDNWLEKPHTWPVGAVDLRWDRERGVWTVPTYDMVFMSTDGTTCTYLADNGRTLYNSAGSNANSSAVACGDDLVDYLQYSPTGAHTEKIILGYHTYNGLTQINRTRRATSYHCILTHDITALSGNVTVNTLKPVDGAPTTATNILATNSYGMTASSGAEGLIMWKSNLAGGGEWILVQAECG